MAFAGYLRKYGVEVVRSIIDDDGVPVVDSMLDLAAVVEGPAAPRQYQTPTPLCETAWTK